MASAGYIKASAPPLIIFLFILQLSLSSLALPLMMTPFVMTSTTTSTTTRASNTTFTKGYIKEERDALLAFKAQIIYHNVHPISSWGHHITDDCCHWPGVHCDNISGHVVRLNLQRRRPRQYYDYYYDYYPKCDEWDLSGNISQSLIGLWYLRYLDLSGNCFTGVIPHRLGNLTRLRYLNLATDVYRLKVDDAEWLSGLSSLRYLLMNGVNFSGVNNVMQSLNKLRHLKNVSLSDCSMNSIPESLPHLNFTSLTFMDIGSNMVDNTTSIPEWLFRIPNLRYLSMRQCGLTGTIPSSIGNATSLQFLDLSRNEGISGDMPRGFGDLCNLLSLYLDGTFLGKSLEEDFRDAFSQCVRRNLNELSFAESSLQGPLPDWLGEFRNLTGLFLSYNSFHGSIPESLGRLSGLQHLNLAYNAFNGSIPTSIGDLCNLQSLYLDRTFLGKSLEEDFRDAFSGCIRRNLNELSFAESSLQGPLPDWLGEFINLTGLFLYDNSFSGSITESLGRLSGLQYLDLAYNVFNGSIPSAIGDLCNLQYLNLGGTFLGKSLEEDFRDAFSGCIRRNLNVLSFGGSWLQGPLPYWLGEFRNLTILNLGSNSFYSSIPASIGRLSRLQRFDVSNNALNGSIPESLGRLSGLQYLYLVNNALNGPIPESLGRLSGLQTLELSHNALNGSIPESLGRLSGLQYLDLENNALNGPIPESLGRLSGLQFLDLANNALNGPIPKTLGRLSGLQFLDLANNSLNGPIPKTLGRLSGLQLFFLRDNELNGPIPETLWPFGQSHQSQVPMS